MNVVNTEFTM